MKMADAVDAFLRDHKLDGRINSAATERSYRDALYAHVDDVRNRDPRKTGRQDIKTTLGRWSHPNTRNNRHAILTSFYKWCVYEGIRDTNPAEQVKRAKRRKTSVYRLTRGECILILDTADTYRERTVSHLGLLAGIRNQEMRGLQLRHFRRPGFIWISADIGKGHKERWIPIPLELEPIVAEIQERLGPEDYVFCARRPANPPANTRWIEFNDRPGSPQAVWRLVVQLAARAGIAAHVHPHLLRHGFGDHTTRYAGLRVSQAMLGHEDISTTQGTYTGDVSLDELQAAMRGFAYRPLSPPAGPGTPLEATTGIEPVDSSSEAVERDLGPSTTGDPPHAPHTARPRPRRPR